MQSQVREVNPNNALKIFALIGILAGLMVFLLSAQNWNGKRMMAVEGTVLTVTTTTDPSNSSRITKTYTMKDLNGNIFVFSVGMQFSEFLSLAVGDHIEKKFGEFTYIINGEKNRLFVWLDVIYSIWGIFLFLCGLLMGCIFLLKSKST